MRGSTRGAVLDAGLQRERTSLAWTRTALALVANGLLVLIRHERAFPLPVAASLCGLSLAMAAVVLVHAGRRGRIVVQVDRDIRPPTAYAAFLAASITLLCLATAASVLIWR